MGDALPPPKPSQWPERWKDPADFESQDSFLLSLRLRLLLLLRRLTIRLRRGVHAGRPMLDRIARRRPAEPVTRARTLSARCSFQTDTGRWVALMDCV